MTEEKRIYVVVAETVDTPNGVVIQPCGRIAAQCAHVVSRMQVNRIAVHGEDEPGGQRLKPCTTIVLAARDSKELDHVMRLMLIAGLPYVDFWDSNSPVYGDGVNVQTAICTQPVMASDLIHITDYLPLWSHGKSV